MKHEAQLSRRNPLPQYFKRMNLLGYSDGHTYIFKISKIINKPLLLVSKEYKFLKTKVIKKCILAFN